MCTQFPPIRAMKKLKVPQKLKSSYGLTVYSINCVCMQQSVSKSHVFSHILSSFSCSILLRNSSGNSWKQPIIYSVTEVPEYFVVNHFQMNIHLSQFFYNSFFDFFIDVICILMVSQNSKYFFKKKTREILYYPVNKFSISNSIWKTRKILNYVQEVLKRKKHNGVNPLHDRERK